MSAEAPAVAAVPFRTTNEPGLAAGRHRALALLAGSTVLAMSAWFSTGAVGPALMEQRGYSSGDLTWMAVAVQAGFVAGTLAVAISNLPDVFRPQRVYLLGATFAALAAISLLPDQSAGIAIASRVGMGVALATVYPVGMKMLAGWYRGGRGLALGVMIGGLAFGSGLPHLFGSIVEQDWEIAIAGSAAATLLGGIVVGLAFRSGPFQAPPAPFRPGFALDVLRARPTALATAGYLGHMWDLYAMWTWAPVFLLEVVGERSVLSGTFGLVGVIAFAVFGVGAAGSIVAGLASERYGRTTAASAAMIASGSIALFIGFVPTGAEELIVVLLLIWGVAVIADSAQFSTAMSELADPRYVGSALSLQTALGFALTIVSIRLLPIVEAEAGWGVAFAMLALGPLLGTLAMLKLRTLPEARQMAGGRR